MGGLSLLVLLLRAEKRRVEVSQIPWMDIEVVPVSEEEAGGFTPPPSLIVEFRVLHSVVKRSLFSYTVIARPRALMPS
ncbi:hypothetical protein LZ31DRAFT_561325 [Colletotrichum somersetense]|nr:hypothetical protein LZ31DRAFT_561325 [Colletotrichum somersetense]